MNNNENNSHHLIAHERQAALILELNKSGYIQVTEMAAKLNTTAMTIRRDLSQLEEEGLCIRKQGGAVRSSQGVTLELPYQIKQNTNVDEKKRIAEEATKLLEHGSTIFLDSGSTTYALALLLVHKRMTVVTNDLQIAVKLAGSSNINLVCTGGTAHPNVFSLQGNQVEAFLRNLRVDLTFLGADAIHKDGTVFNVNLEESYIKQAMIKAAKKVVLLADSSKFEKTGFAKVCCLSELDMIITDRGISRETRKLIKSMKIKAAIV
jgi:DeoR/GlpR family transcriptional regulator of sugar metabolism